MSAARFYQAQVTILFCYRLIAANDEGDLQNMKRDIETKALKQFHEIEKKLGDTPTVSYQFVTEVGFFPFRIEMFIRKSTVNLLVMGNSVIENFNEYKSVSFDQFLLKTKIPVVVVPEEMEKSW